MSDAHVPSAALAVAAHAAASRGTGAPAPAPAADTARRAPQKAQHAALIALDWGTTALRAYLIDSHGEVIATRASTAGIMNLPRPADQGGFDAAFDAAVGAWLDSAPHLPVIAAGMVGSAQGWREAPYVDTPAAAQALVAGIVDVETARGVALHIVPGVLQRGDMPNVMRGEETQILGALDHDAQAQEQAQGTTHAATHALIGLPGTHAKWVSVEGGCIECFHTFMTGEVFAALREHTILGRTMITPDRPDHAAFLRGVRIARDKGEAGALATIFSTRTLGLTGQLASEQQPDYLSGLLIGHELSGLDAALTAQHASLKGHALRLIGNEALCERYRVALAEFGCTQVDVVKHATERGLWRIAVAAGLVRESGAQAARNG